MLARHAFFAFFALSFFLASCEQVITIELPEHEPKILAYGNLQEGSQKLELWLSQSYSSLNPIVLDSNMYSWEDEYPMASAHYLQNAQADLYKDGQFFGSFEFNSQSRYYELDLSEPWQKGNSNWELRIAAAELTPVQTQIQGGLDFELLDAEYKPQAGFDEEGFPIDAIDFRIRDLGLGNQYYEIEPILVLRDTGEFGFGPRRQPVYAQSKDPRLEEALFGGLLLSNESIFGQEAQFRIEFDGYEPSMFELHFSIRAIHRDRYLYLRSLSQQLEAQGNPLAEPVVLYSNIENGRGLLSSSLAKERKLVD